MNSRFFEGLKLVLRASEFWTLLAVGAIVILTALTTIDFLSNDDSMSVRSASDAVINSEIVQYEIRVNEAKFRDSLFNAISTFYLNNKFAAIDSISEDTTEADEIKKSIILSKLKASGGKYVFDIKIGKLTTPLVVLQQIHTTFEIDFDRLYNILKSSKSKILDDNIRYGNFIKTRYSYIKEIKIEYLIAAVFLILALLAFGYFLKRIGGKNEEYSLEQTAEELNDEKKSIKEAKKLLEDENIKPEEISRVKKLLDELELNLNSYDFENILKSVLYEDVLKSERRSNELYNRSTLMLILGLLVAVAGIVTFYFTLPNFSNLKSTSDYLATTIRPSLILLFIQSISFYLLRQYRSLINDYKYFYNEYLKKSRTFTAYQLLQNENVTPNEMKLIDSLLISAQESTFSGTDNKDDVPNDKVAEIVKVVLEKIK